MNMASTQRTDTFVVYVILTVLGLGLRPCYVGRRGPRTYLLAHADALTHEGILWATQYLSIPEREYIRRAIGFPPIGQLIDPALMETRLGDILDVSGLRLPVQRRPTILPVTTPEQGLGVDQLLHDWT